MTLLMLALLGCTGSSEPSHDDHASTDAKTEAVAEAPAEEAAPEEPAEAIPARYTAMFKAIETIEPAADEADKIALGRMLYYDTRLSQSGEISCNSCHMLDRFGVDGEPTSPGHEGQRGVRNSPTVYNAADHIAQFWDGRAADLAAQAKGPILNPVEMAMPDEATVVATLEAVEGYKSAFGKVYDDGITYDNLADAIGAFEKYLVTPSRFDSYLAGEADALTAEEKAGLELFVSTGCTTCHMGKDVGGSMYQKLGLVEPYETEDEGRKAVTGKDADLHVFKVPSLRNVTETGPYFHDGSIKTLEEAVGLMAKHQLGKELKDDEIASIVTFLAALTGTPDEAYIAKPELPEG